MKIWDAERHGYVHEDGRFEAVAVPALIPFEKFDPAALYDPYFEANRQTMALIGAILKAQVGFLAFLVTLSLILEIAIRAHG